MLLEISLDNDIKNWLSEDIPYWDLTTSCLTKSERHKNENVTAKIYAKQEGVISGTQVVKRIFELVGVKTIKNVKEGSYVEKGEILFVLNGFSENILRVERVALNIFSHMSGISTATNKFVTEIKNQNLNTIIAATRKTLPGLRKYQKWAITIGGGDTHRLDLSSMVLLKENHLQLFQSITDAVTACRASISFSQKIEVEVTNEKEFEESLKTDVDIIMLDNFKPSEIIELLKMHKKNTKILLEASGNIESNNFLDYAKAGVDIISMGKLTHSSTNFDMSLLID